MRRFLIRTVLPLFFCVLPPLAAVLIAAALPDDARDFYLNHFTALDGLILGLGAFLFFFQMIFGWRALRWRGTSFDERPDKWLTHLAQAAEWFPLLGLIGTVAGILQTFGTMPENAEFDADRAAVRPGPHGHRQRPVRGPRQHSADLDRAGRPRPHPHAERRAPASAAGGTRDGHGIPALPPSQVVRR